MIAERTIEIYDYLTCVSKMDKLLSLKKGDDYSLLYKEENCGFHNKKRIDLVVRGTCNDENNKEKTYQLGTGVEIKTSYEDFHSGDGINFYTYPHTYLLITKFKSYKKVIEHVEKATPHVGIMIYDNLNIDIIKKAQFYECYDKRLYEKMNVMSEEEYLEKSNYKMLSTKEKEKIKNHYFDLVLSDCVLDYLEDAIRIMGKMVKDYV